MFGEDIEDYLGETIIGFFFGVSAGILVDHYVLGGQYIVPNEVYVTDVNDDGLQDVFMLTKAKTTYQFMQHKDGEYKKLEDVEKYDRKTLGEKIRDFNLKK
jgi:hypothetical protein